MVKRFSLLLLLGAALVTSCKDDDDDKPAVTTNTTELTATLNGNQQVPVNASTATGTFSGTYNADTKLLRYTVNFTGLTPIAAHIHIGGPGRNGGVKVPFNDLTSPIEGEQTLDQQTADSLMANRTYVNLHTTTSPNGEIRGNITKK